MKSYLPFEIKSSPIRKLALIPFEKKPDTVYKGFELQYIDGEPYGTGYRVLAIRNDNFVDVYDDFSLNYLENETFHVAGNGLHRHVQTSIKNVQFNKVENNQRICFEFADIEGRPVQVKIIENTKGKTKPMNLLAPIGLGSKKPNYLPVFFLYDFDFIRKRKTEIICKIGEQEISIDAFPMPMNGQTRLYARCSNECELLEFANTDMSLLQEIQLNGENIYRKEKVEYIFECENVLKKVIVHFKDNQVECSFEPSLQFTKSCHGIYTIKPRQQMGYLQGEYNVLSDKNTVIKMLPKEGWISKPNSFITKLILSKNSVFCTWSKKYEFNSVINWKTKKVEAYWKNGNIK